jgi:Flp pilus assembly pilin Flp
MWGKERGPKVHRRCSGGQGMVEYILIVALIAIIVIAGVRMFGGQIKDLFKNSADKIQSEGNSALQDK